ncbi:MAG: cobyric acid synthase [Geitlerinemataceae cyanobacterium]
MKSIVVLGASSNVGKSTISMVLCRLLARQRQRVTPFKAHNISRATYLTDSGHRIPYAQALQAWAAGLQPSLNIAPIWLEPESSPNVRVHIGGQQRGVCDLADFYGLHRQESWALVQSCLNQLVAQYDALVCEGSGNPVDVSLEDGDLASMQVSRYLDARTVLVVDGGRGGAIAHAIGTLELMAPEDRDRLAGLIVNKFDGSLRLLERGLANFRARTQLPVLGVIPRRNDLFERPRQTLGQRFERTTSREGNKLTIAAICLPRTASFADFEPLEAEPSVTVKYLKPGDSLGYPDAAIVPSSRSTIADLRTLQESSMAQEIRDYVSAGGTVFGILGGYHMLGETIADPEGIEGIEGRHQGLGILPVRTVIGNKRIASQRTTASLQPQEGLMVSGYERHQTRTQVMDTKNVQPIFDEARLGSVDRYGAVWGVNLHGVFDSGPWRRTWLNRLRQQRGFTALPTGIGNHRAEREEAIDAITDEFARSLDLEALFASD